MRSISILLVLCLTAISACKQGHKLTPHEEFEEYLIRGGQLPALENTKRASNMYLAGIKNGVPVRIARVILSDYNKKTKAGENKYDVALRSAKEFNLVDEKVVSLIIDYKLLSLDLDDDRDTSPE